MPVYVIINILSIRCCRVEDAAALFLLDQDIICTHLICFRHKELKTLLYA